MGATSIHAVDRNVRLEIDIPDVREYETESNAALDHKLLDAIEAAREADNSYLARLLTYELGSHYWDTR